MVYYIKSSVILLHFLIFIIVMPEIQWKIFYYQSQLLSQTNKHIKVLILVINEICKMILIVSFKCFGKDFMYKIR